MVKWILALGLLVPGLASAHELGLNVHLSPSTGPTVTKDAGLKWVRIDLNWDIAQPADAVPDFTIMDACVNAAIAKNLSVLAVIGYTPAWASSADTDPSSHQNDVPVAGKYEAFVALAVAHFKDRVTHYELWNEPNLGQFFEGTSQQYIDLILKPGSDAVRAQCPTCKVVGPGLASLAASKYDLWLDAILKQADAKVDILNGHIYANFSEDSSGAGTTSDSFLNRLESHRVISFNGIVIYEAQLSFKEVMDKNASTKPFWLTETGTMAASSDATALANQTRYYRRVLEKASVRPWWTTTIFYEAYDVPPTPATTWGIALETGPGTYSKKPVFDFLKQALQGLAFGGSNPACSDFLDNDDDGKIDFPDDTDCLDPTGTSEGPAPVNDLSMSGGELDSGAGAPDGMITGTTPGGPGGGSPPVDRGCHCSYGGADPRHGLVFLFLALAIALRLSRRRT